MTPAFHHSGDPILPGQWLGMLGGGQLGRMFCQAAQQMGYRVAVLDPDPSSPAGMLADWHVKAAYNDSQALSSLAKRCQAVSTEFENIPAESLAMLAKDVAVHPAAHAVQTVQDRRSEKAFLSAAGVPVAPYHVVEDASDLDSAPALLFPGILKVARFGYDGKGQISVSSRQELKQAWKEVDSVPCVLEARMPLEGEVSVVLARDPAGRVASYPVLRNEHQDGILVRTLLDRSLPSNIVRQAHEAAITIAEKLNYVGVLCVEFFLLAQQQLVVNEVAPRPHNSGHITMDACHCSQFEQQVRVLCGLPPGATEACQEGIMLNILGDIWFPEGCLQPTEPDWAAVLAIPQARLHLYGKTEVRKGRKMGHVNLVAATMAEAQGAAREVANILGISLDAS